MAKSAAMSQSREDAIERQQARLGLSTRLVRLWVADIVCSYAGIIQIRFRGSAQVYSAPSQPASWLPVRSDNGDPSLTNASRRRRPCCLHYTSESSTAIVG